MHIVNLTVTDKACSSAKYASLCSRHGPSFTWEDLQILLLVWYITSPIALTH